MPVISKITGAPFRFWCQKILPAVYDDSLSYYELLCKVVDYLNKVMEDDINVVNLVNSLEEYMNNYFENLDVQTEINNKLDSMVEDGTLMSIIAPYLDPQIEELDNKYTTFAGDVTELVNEMSDNVDNTLTSYNSNIVTQNERIQVLESRMDSFASLPDGSLSTAADAELADIRVGALGEPYPTAGDAVRDQINLLRNGLVESEEITWGTTEAYPYGWREGYYVGGVGEPLTTSGSGRYMRAFFALNSENYSEFGKALFISVTPPAGYSIRIQEVDSEDEVTAVKGQINTTDNPEWIGLPVIMATKPNHKYAISIGRWESDSGQSITQEFISSIKLKFYYYRTTADTELEDIRLGANGVIYDTAGNAVRGQYSALFNRITTAKLHNWSPGSSQPTGWKGGFFTGEVGKVYTTNGNTRQICAVRALNTVNYPDLINAYFIRVKPPVDKAIRILEVDKDTDIIVNKYGDSDPANVASAVGKAMTIPVNGALYKYLITIGRFEEGDAATYAADAEYIEDITLEFITLNSEKEFKARTGDFEWFSVTVDRPLPFNDEGISTTTEEVECVLRLPATYSTTGKPVPLVLMCHGHSGYISKDTGTWYNSNWKALCDALLNAGFALFDVNVLPTSLGTDVCGKCYGSPLAVNNAKKAYDYITENYNVSKKIFVHGTSMGGTLANAFTQTYGNLVIAQSSFAGRDITQYISQIGGNTMEEESIFALAYGYATYQDLLDDKFSHVAPAPSLTYKRYSTSGSVIIPPLREDNFANWLQYFGGVQQYSQNDDIPVAIAVRSIPYKSWNSWSDNPGRTKGELVLKKAYDMYGGCEYNCVVYDSYNHTQMSYGQVEDMRDRLISWYKKFL